MKFLRSPKPDSAGRPFVFLITKRERAVLLATLKMFPLLDAGYHKLSRDPKATSKAEQQWLEEAMQQQQEDHKKRLGQLFSGERRFFKEEKGDSRLTLNGEQIEWMQRVLNEVRVGSWVRLGCPEMEEAARLSLSSEKARFVASMELSGYFESVLLEAFSG